MGKTTLLSKLAPQPLPGITTWAVGEKGVWLRENGTERTAPIGIFDPMLSLAEQRMALCREGFLNLGIPALDRAGAAPGEWAAIDEIGYLETDCPEFCDAIRQLMERKRVIAVLRKQDTPFLRELRRREDAFVVDLDRPFGNLGCVILASGLGRRFGGNKLMAPFHGKPLICYALDATEGIFAQRIVATRHEDVAALCKEREVDVILHDLPGRNDTVRLGLQAMEPVAGCLFCPGDQPLLKRETVEALALSAVEDPESIWRPCFAENPGAPVLFPQWVFPELLMLPQGKGGGFVAKMHPQRVRTLPVRDAYELRDVDTPEDLAELSERWV